MKILLTLTLSTLLNFSSPSWGADFNKGLAAERSGDFETALREWTPLAEGGYLYAQFNLGQMYNKGDGVPQDYKTAVKWFSLAAEQGHVKAQHNLGVMYGNGYGVLKDYVYAHMWSNTPASNGDKVGAEQRDNLVNYMTPSQVEKAQDLARKCVAKNYKDC